MKEWKDLTPYAGLDWARDHHAVVIVDGQGKIVADFEFAHSREGWQGFREKTAAFPNLADALRVDGQGWKALRPLDLQTQPLRWLCKDEVVLIQQRTLLVNQLQQALVEYYPAALEAFDDWTGPFT